MTLAIWQTYHCLVFPLETFGKNRGKKCPPLSRCLWSTTLKIALREKNWGKKEEKNDNNNNNYKLSREFETCAKCRA